MTTKFDFQAWLTTKPDDEKYDYFNNCGGCAMGQFMASRGEQWDYTRYIQLATEVFGGYHTPLIESKTFGELKKRLELV